MPSAEVRRPRMSGMERPSEFGPGMLEEEREKQKMIMSIIPCKCMPRVGERQHRLVRSTSYREKRCIVL